MGGFISCVQTISGLVVNLLTLWERDGIVAKEVLEKAERKSILA